MQKVTLSELDTGERIISERVASVRSVSLGFWIDVGSRDERADRAGVSHFIEHLLFKGSSRYSAQGIAELFDAMGGELNAATSRETTVVYTRVPDGHLTDALDAMTDDEVIGALTKVKGIGRWSAEMFLIFRLQRPDVLPLGDLGILNAIQKAYRLRKKPTAARMSKLGEAWKPYRSVASWYLWRSLDNEPVKTATAKEKASR